MGENDTELLFISVTTYFKRKSVLLTNQVTVPLIGSTTKSVPFVSIEYFNVAEMLLVAKIWKVYCFWYVTMWVAGPWMVGGNKSGERKRKYVERNII